MKVIVVASLAWSLINFRGRLIAALRERGHAVIACAPDRDAAVEAALADMGVAFRPLPLDRARVNPAADVATLARLVTLFRRERPDAVLAYTQKPIVYAGIATRIVGGIRFHAMVSGLGVAFTEGGGRGRRLLRRTVALLYRLALKRASSVILFNRDDGEEMLASRMIGEGHLLVRVGGSGVDLARFPARPISSDGAPPVFLMVARLRRDKGVEDYVAAARQVKAVAPGLAFRLLGPPDASAAGVGAAALAGWQAEGVIDYLGETRDVAPHLAAASVVVLPTRYREGLPRVLLEAMSTGRAIITTDAPGCRETVEPGRNGFVIPVGDGPALAAAMLRFVHDPELAVRMGRQSREICEERFSVEQVNATLIATIEGAAANASPERHDARRGVPRFT